MKMFSTGSNEQTMKSYKMISVNQGVGKRCSLSLIKARAHTDDAFRKWQII